MHANFLAAGNGLVYFELAQFSSRKIQFRVHICSGGCASRFVQQTNFGSKLEVLLDKIS
jgi:hypothetical protein